VPSPQLQLILVIVAPLLGVAEPLIVTDLPFICGVLRLMVGVLGSVVPELQLVMPEQTALLQALTLKEYVVLAERPVTGRVVLEVLPLLLVELQVPPV
jgi:hypothetical protein